MNILFVCSKNKWRSRTAESIFKNNGTHQIKSAGTAASARIRINQKLLNWADKIYVMEDLHKKRILADFDIQAPITVLEIPDIYPYMDEELISILEDSVIDLF